MIPEYHVSTAAQFWSELEDILSVPAQATLEEIDLAMRTFVFFCARYYHEYLSSSNPELEYAVHEFDRALHMLLESHFYNSHSDRMVNIAMDLVEMRHSQDSQHGTTQLHLLLRLLIQHGTQKPHVFKLLRQPRMSATRQTSRPFIQMLIEVLNRTEEEAHASGENSSVEGMVGSDTTILLYEVLRVKRLSSEELPLFEEKFIRHLFEIIEQTRDGDEEYNYCLVRLIIALNEQFMVAGLEHHTHSHGHGHHGNHKKSSLPTESHNLVLKIIKDKLGNSKTFGENLIFILNRLNSSGGEASPEDLCTSLLILKILYLLFSTSSTSEYFYTNDLRVLVDVFIRELLDLPEESEGLRHTYLRVLHPLMTNTQLRTYPYKHAELRSTLLALLSNEHIRTVSPTTRRLVERNLSAEWCTALDPPPTSTQAVQAEAKLAKEMSTMALKSPKVGLLKVEEGLHSNGQSTTSVNAVAGAEMSPARNRKISLSGFLGKNRASPKDPQQQQGQPADQPDRQPFHYRIRKPSSRGPNEQQSQLSGSVDSVLPSFASKKSKVPPPRPPKSARSLETSQSLPGTPPESADSLSADDASIKTTRSRRAPPPTPSRKRGHTQSQPENGQTS